MYAQSWVIDVFLFFYSKIDNIDSPDDSYQYSDSPPSKPAVTSRSNNDSFEMLLKNMQKTLAKRKDISNAVA